MNAPRSSDSQSVLEARFDAQKIAFAPFVFQAAKTLRDLGILNTVHAARRDGITAAAVAADRRLGLYGVKVLLEFGVAIGLLSVEGDRYRLTKTGLMILGDSLTRVNMDFVHDVCYRGLFHLQEAVSEGRPAGLRLFGPWQTLYEGLAALPPRVRQSWFAFDHYYSDLAFPEALPRVFRQPPEHLFDVGGNTGKWALACADYDPRVRITILDLPGQLAEARAAVRAAGRQDRIDCVDIDLLDNRRPFPPGADAIWMSQFLDCFSEEQIVAILTRAAAAMGPDTDLYILEPFWNRQRFDAARFALQATSLYFTCMANGNSKMYHADDMIRCVASAGLSVVEDIDGIGLCHTLLHCRRRAAQG